MPDMVPAYIEDCNNRMEEAGVAGYMRFAKNESLFLSESDEWCTPSHIGEACAEVLGGIDMDLCSNRGEPSVPAKGHFAVDGDGLAQEWAGSVFMSPPYGRALPRWVRKLRSEVDAGRVTEAIALLPARPGSDWFEEAAVGQVCFLRGRLRFSGGGPAPFPSMLACSGCRGCS